MAHPTNAEQDLVTPCVLLLNSLALHSVSNAWVDSIWDGQFTESQELPMDYVEVIQGVEVKEVFARLQELTIKWIKVHKQEEDSTIHSISLYRVGFWTIMSEQNIKLKVLVALLYHYMERGQKMASGDQERQLAIQAAGLYLVLIGLPGSETFEIFHPRLYTKALDTFMMVKELGLDKKSPNKKGGAMKDAQPSQQSGIQTSQDGDKEEEEGMAALSQREVGKVLEGLVEVLNCLHIMLDNCSLKMSLESIEVTVGSLVTLTHLETTISEMDFVGWNRNTSVSSLAVNAYLGLAKVCSPLHGEGAGGVAEVLKGLLPGVLMIGEKPTKVLEVIRAHTLRFIRFLMVGGGQAACRAASVLVQHMAAKVHNKVEFRREAAEAIVSLMGALPEDLFSSTVRWFVRYAHSEEASNRLFSLEVVGRLMYSTTLHSQPISNDFLFACIYNRCDDISVSVRAQAFKKLEEITGEQVDCMKEVLDTIFAPDKASRGQVSLTDVLDDPNLDLSNVDFLPSGDELIQFLRSRALGQSVFVRNSANQVLENILKTSDYLMAWDCRDSSLEVRKQVVTSLTENAEKTSTSKVGEFMRILRDSPHHMSKIKDVEVYKVVKRIEKDSLPAGLSDMTKKVFFKKVDSIVQQNILHGDPFCPICLRRFWNEKERDNHVAVLHRKKKMNFFSCKDCDKSFMSESALQYHTRVHHSSAAKVKCSVCESVFSDIISLHRHKKIHNEEAEIFKCLKCEQSFRRKDKLTRHRKSVHNFVNIKLDSVESLKKEDHFTCKICDMSFIGLDSKDQLIEHLIRKCKPDERLSCNSCDKDFSTKSNLTQHKRTAHYTMPQTVFRCDVKFCGFLTKYNTSLTRHMKSMHSDI